MNIFIESPVLIVVLDFWSELGGYLGNIMIPLSLN